MTESSVEDQPPEIQLTSREKRFRSTLDTLAAIRVSDVHQEFAVSLSYTPAGATLYISQTGVTPHHAAKHLIQIRTLLTRLKANRTSSSAISTSLDIDDAGSLLSQLGAAIYRHSFPKFRHHFMKRQQSFFSAYDSVIGSGRIVTDKDKEICQFLFDSFTLLRDVFERTPQLNDVEIYGVFRLIYGMHGYWKSYVDGISGGCALSAWRHYGGFSLTALLEKIFLYQAHLSTLVNIAMSDRYAVFLDGEFDVQALEPSHRDVLIDVKSSAISQIDPPFFLPRSSMIKDEDVYNLMVNNILKQARECGKELPLQAQPENSVKLLFQDTAVHCECVLVAHHYLNPQVPVFHYIGLSKRPCFACYAYIIAFNRVFAREDRDFFDVKVARDAVCFAWASPPLVPVSVDSVVRSIMTSYSLYRALRRYAQHVKEDLLPKYEYPEPIEFPFHFLPAVGMWTPSS
jgi:hypothetical protein